MEELWKDIHQSENNNPRISRGFFEDMLGGQQVGENEFKSNNNNNNDDDEDDKNGIFKKELLMSSVISTPGFMSSLNSPFEALATNAVVASNNSPGSSLLNNSCFPIITTNNNNKRPLSETHRHCDVIEGETGVDRRHKRMIKNRESAARSRARRQAYTSQLEKEHEELKEENNMLRKQQQQLQLLLSTPAQVPKKCTHNRSHTF